MKPGRTIQRCFLVLGLALAVYAFFVILNRPRNNEFAFELSKWQIVFCELGRSIANYAKTHDGKLPESFELLRPQMTEDIPEQLKQDETGSRIFYRTVLLTDVDDRNLRRHHPWMIAVLWPKHGNIKEDLIVFGDGGEYGFNGAGSSDANGTERAFGRDVVDAVYKKDREDREHAATQADKGQIKGSP